MSDNNYVLIVVGLDDTRSSYPCWGLNKTFLPGGSLEIETLERNEDEEIIQGTVIRLPEGAKSYYLVDTTEIDPLLESSLPAEWQDERRKMGGRIVDSYEMAIGTETATELEKLSKSSPWKVGTETEGQQT